MRRNIAVTLVLITLGVAGCDREEADPAVYSIIPLPQEMEAEGGGFAITENTWVVLAGDPGPEVESAVEGWAAKVRRATALPLPVVSEGPDDGAILIRIEEEDEDPNFRALAGMGLPGIHAESYDLEVRSRGVRLEAGGAPGVFYGLETLGQLIPALRGVEESPLSSPGVDIEDGPRFPYRGMHLDVGRHLFPVPFIKRYLDFLAAYKMNVFHWHLTEDQGWRIEILGYPKLTEVGSCRAETILEKNFNPYIGDGIPYCGFYTQEEIREVVDYARERFITVIPEIEMPGHSVAALAAYPELACTDGPFQVSTRWGVTRDIYCPKEETFDFLEDVLSEVLELFPSPYIHIGGDEAPKYAWENSPLAQEVIQREGLADEHELQSWFIRRIETFLNGHGRNLVGWDEILEGGLAPNATVMSWRGMAGGMAAAQQGHDVIMTPNSHVYLDFYQGDTIQEPLAIGGFSPLERVYAFEPVPPELTEAEAAHVLGGQGNVWTEYMATTEYVEYMILPRMLALSEVVWSPQEARDWESFVTRLPAHLSRLDGMEANYRIPDVLGLEGDGLTLEDWALIDLSAPVDGGGIRYTLDGSDPGPNSPAFTDPFSLDLDEEGVQVAARVVLSDGRAGAVKSARIRRARLTPAVSLPRAGRTPGLAGQIFLGDFSSVDSIPLAAMAAGAGNAPIPTPKVALPESSPPSSFGMRLTGLIRVPRNGIFTFFLSSDDGSRLSIGAQTIIDHDGFHSMSEKRGQAALRRGWHPIDVGYFQGGGGAGIRLEIEGPGVTRREVPAYWLANRAQASDARE